MKKKILFIIWSYTYGGGAEALLTSIVNNLNPEKYDISILEYRHAYYKTEPTNDYVHILPYISAIDEPDRAKKTYYVYNEPEVAIERFTPKGYDLYISFNYQIPSFLLPFGTKNIAWIHGDVYDLADQPRERRLQCNVFDRAEKIVSISDNTEQSLIDLFPAYKDKFVKIYNGVDVKRIEAKAKEETDVHLQHPAVVTVGRLEDNKNQLRNLDILKLVHDRNVPVHMYFLGTGDQKDDILKKAKQYGLEEYVHLLGYIANPFPIVKQADMSMLLSKSEGFNMSICESLSLGVPFIATNVGSMRLLSNNEKCGSIIQKDEDAANAIIAILNNGKGYYESTCKEWIDQFRLEKYIEQIEDLFDRVLGTVGSEK